MRVRKTWALFALILFFVLIGCSEDPENNADVPIYDTVLTDVSQGVEHRSDENGVSISVGGYTQVSLTFKITGAKPLSICSVSIKLDASGLAQSDGTSVNGSLFSEHEHDINSAVVEALGTPSDDGTCKIKRLIKLDEHGEAIVSLKLGDDAHLVIGDAYIYYPICTDVENDTDYLIYDAADNTVRFIFNKKDIERSGIAKSTLSASLERISELNAALAQLTGHANALGNRIDFVFTENIPFTALAGNPIYINRAEVDYMLGSLKEESANDYLKLEKNDFTAILCHELSHTYDVIQPYSTYASYCFDREFFATLKAMLAMKKCGIELSDSYLSAVPSLESGMYNYEVFIMRILEAVKSSSNDAYVVIGQALKSLSVTADDASSAAEKYFAFMQALDEASDGNIYEEFSATELETLNKYFASKDNVLN